MGDALRFQRGEQISLVAVDTASVDFDNPRAVLKRYTPDDPVCEADFIVTPGSAPNVIILTITSAVCAVLLPGFYRFNLAYDVNGETIIDEATEVEITDTTTL